ncbi:cyclic nucleotide-binding domain-containing protein [Ignavibacterium sp.]|jgi:CRP-like cAMP-binding protein|uniref:Crp/Fnr family transcriptional regulator n=1 Tax=Ignavibacterium sp. TaxID=2651167 RepID=UPI003298D274
MKTDFPVRKYGELQNQEFLIKGFLMTEEKTKIIKSSFWTNFFNSPTERHDLEKSLSSIPLFSSLSRKELKLLLEIIHNRTYVAGEFIFLQGDPGIGLYIVREGEVEIRRKDNSGKEHTLANFVKGDFFGELALVDGEKRSASAIALTDCRISVLFKPDLDEFIEKFPKKGIKILQGISVILAERLRKLNEDYFQLLITKSNGS